MTWTGESECINSVGRNARFRYAGWRIPMPQASVWGNRNGQAEKNVLRWKKACGNVLIRSNKIFNLFFQLCFVFAVKSHVTDLDVAMPVDEVGAWHALHLEFLC